MVSNQPQGSFNQQALNGVIPELVEDLMRKRGDAKPLKKAEKLAKEKLEEALDDLELLDGEYRVGNTAFVIKRRTTEDAEVEFIRQGKRRYSVSVSK